MAAQLSEPYSGIKHRVRAWQELSAAQLGMNRQLWKLVLDPQITDILINSDTVWVDGAQGMRRLPGDFLAGANVKELAQNLAIAAGRRLDYSCPIVDATVGSNIRLHAVLAPVANPGPLISLRILHRQNHSFGSLVEGGICTAEEEELLRIAVQERKNILISGATGSGKTTLLNALLALAKPDERILCIEESTELSPDHPHVVYLQERQANVEGLGQVKATELLRAALRMRPDRIVLGECRGAEVLDVMMALNTGHDGGFATIHANSIFEIPARLQALGVLAGVGANAVAVQAVAAFDVLIHLERKADNRRQVAQIGALEADSETLTGMRVRALGLSDGAKPC